MPESNYERMIQLAESVFDTKSDPDQLDVDEKVIERLLRIHPSTVSEFDDGNGPVVWILVLPTTSVLMKLFLNKEISEKELFYTTPIEAILMPSTYVPLWFWKNTEEKGLARKMTLEAVENIRKEHPIKTYLFGHLVKKEMALAERVAQLAELPLLKLITSRLSKFIFSLLYQNNFCNICLF
ncbi:MAG: hypothetical protein IPP79_01725 [Chitinophagaceae bacterium]|nr:hypothetical protein [Chitinophagaceae bacterium]